MLVISDKMGLVLQFPMLLQAASDVALLRGPLVAAAPAGPGHDVVERGWRAGGGPEEADQEAADLGDGDRDVDGAAG